MSGPITDPAKMTFLIVDDVDNMRRSVRAMLKLARLGRRYYEAANGREAWKMLTAEDFRPDFIICDYKMPHMSGTELLHRVRSHAGLRDIPFLMITAEANMEVVAEAAEHDVDAYLTKPFVTATLEQKIRELIERIANPPPQEAHLRKARALEERGNIDGAIREAMAAAAANGNASRPLRELGRLHVRKGELERACEFFKKATAINRLDVVSYHYLGQIYHRLGDIDAAVENLSRAMEISPRHYDRALKFANLLFGQGRDKEAERILRLVLRYHESSPDIREEVAETCMRHGLARLAARTFRAVLRQAPERTHILRSLGMALHLAGENQEAVRVMENAVEKLGEDQELLLHLARAYLEMGMKVRAEKWANRVLAMDPSCDEAREITRQCL